MSYATPQTPTIIAVERSSSEGSWSDHSQGNGSAISDATLNDVGDPEDQQQQSSGEWRDGFRIWIKAQRHPQASNIRKNQHRRTLVLCFDGTGDQCDADNSNVVNFVSLLKKHENHEQLVYYQSGIGTYTNIVVKALGLKGIYELLDEMFALNLASHVQAGYEFLMQNYTDGDKICIFGFSRGAYTARAVAGMLQKVGLLPLCNYQQVPFAYDMYQRTDVEGLEICETFKRTFCRTVHVEFLGVWDTVASVGAIPQYLPFVSEDNGIRHLRHALSLDERRVKFLPTFSVSSRMRQPQVNSHDKLKGKEVVTPLKRLEDEVNAASHCQTDVSQVWFAGVHTDVGGGSVSNETKHALARIPLRWMVRECFRCDTGIIFDAVMLQQIGIGLNMDGKNGPTLLDVPARISGKKPDDMSLEAPAPGWVRFLWTAVATPLTKIADFVVPGFNPPSQAKDRTLAVAARGHNQRYARRDNLNEAEEEWRDARSPIHDQLKESWWLWLGMEWFPWRIKKNKAILNEEDDLDAYEWIWNRGQGREVHRLLIEAGMRVHRSVKTRLEADFLAGGQYVPHIRPHIRLEGQEVCQIRRLKYDEWTTQPVKHWEWVDDWSPSSSEGSWLRA